MAKSPQGQVLSGYENNIEHIRPTDKRFLWYMVVHFLMSSNTERSTKAPDGKTDERYAKYTPRMLSTCTQNLKIPEGRVWQAKRKWVTCVAENFDDDLSKDKNSTDEGTTLITVHEVESDRCLKSSGNHDSCRASRSKFEVKNENFGQLRY